MLCKRFSVTLQHCEAMGACSFVTHSGFHQGLVRNWVLHKCLAVASIRVAYSTTHSAERDVHDTIEHQDAHRLARHAACPEIQDD